MKTSINFKAVKSDSETHNFRKKSFDYIRKDLTSKNEYWQEQKIANRLLKIENYCKEKSGRKLQKNAIPIREAVVVIKENTTMLDLHNLSKKLEEELKIKVFQIAIHKDEGHYDKDTKEWKPNYHAHLVADWQDLETGKTLKHQSFHYSIMQDITAECLGMERGKIGGTLKRLEALEFKIQKREQDLQELEERLQELQAELKEKNEENLVVKESDFLGFQRVKTEKTLENYKKALKVSKAELVKNHSDLDKKTQQVAELKTKIESLNKELQISKNKNALLLTNSNAFAVEKKNYLDSLENLLTKSLLSETIKHPPKFFSSPENRKETMLKVIENLSRENGIPKAVFTEVFNTEGNIKKFMYILFENNDARNEVDQKKSQNFRRKI